MVEAEATFKADLEKLLKNEDHMPEDKFLVMSARENVLGSRLRVLISQFDDQCAPRCCRCAACHDQTAIREARELSNGAFEFASIAHVDRG
jgi:hypothetical protein